MSKWGAHISLGKRDGFGAALAQCHAAGSPVPVLFALDQNVMDDVVRYSPSTVLIFRTQIGGYPNPPGLWNDDPVGLAEAWYQYRSPIWRQNPAHYYAPGNEYDPQTLEQFDWLDRYELRLMQLADQDGIKLAIGAHSTGTPSDDDISTPLGKLTALIKSVVLRKFSSTTTNTTRYARWLRLIESLRYAKRHGHILLLHEYGFDGLLRDSAPYHALRHRSALDFLAQYEADPRVVISECSAFNGYTPGLSAWFDDLIWYDEQIMLDPRVIGCCAYQLGGAENWYKLIPRWADYVATHPTPTTPPPPPPPPPLETAVFEITPAPGSFEVIHGTHLSDQAVIIVPPDTNVSRVK